MKTSANQPASTPEIIGVLPAGGHASRLAPLPCSKELYPVGFRPVGSGDSRPKVVGHYLLEKMQQAGASKAFIILREGKWDIPAYFGDGTLVGLPLAYLMMNLPYGAPYTLDQAYPFVNQANIVFGFPDILFQPDDAFTRMFKHQAETKADIVLGLFRADNPEKMDMVEFDEQQRVRRIVIKPKHQTALIYTWIIAVWTPAFTEFMHTFLERKLAEGSLGAKEVFVGDVIQAAIDAGLNVESVIFSEGRYIDIGTPEDLAKATYRYAKMAIQTAGQ
ncbi:MAG: dTDP-glucose pyrophosphorylase [Anaerolineae bacterium]|nr:dTDP-glucose pyrophosphorylase [Anaerolineae bacterium]